MDEQIERIAERGKQLARHSWEYGSLSQALLEIYDPELTPFAFVCVKQRHVTPEMIENAHGLQYAKRFIRIDAETLVDGEGSVGDPASLGVAALWLGKIDMSCREAAERQKDVLLNRTLRLANGAISHRAETAELWSDFTYMAPPFLAFHAWCADDAALMQDCLSQCFLQEEILCDKATGLWRHIIGAGREDRGFWSTGNGWAALGLVRVLATFRSFQDKHPTSRSNERELRLETIITSIIEGCVGTLKGNGVLLRNYLDDESWFAEKAGSAAIASTIFRMAVLRPELISKASLVWANAVYEVVVTQATQDGTILPVVNPMECHDREPQAGSAEGQAFALHLIAARRDWESAQVGLQ